VDWILEFKHYYLFFIISVIIFCVYATTRETTVDADTPAFLMLSCQGSNPQLNTQPLTPLFFSLLPCNMLAFKLVACIILLACTLILAKTGELIDKKNGWLAGLFAYINMLWIPDLLKLEEQSLAYPLMFASSYFLIKYIFSEEKHSMLNKNLLASAALLGCTALFWRGAYIYIFLLASYWIIAAIASIPAFILKAEWWINYFTQGLAAHPIQENLWGFGVFHQWLLLLGTLCSCRKLFPAIAFTLIITFFSQKYTLYAVPFLACGLLIWVGDNEEIRLGKGLFYPRIMVAAVAIGLIAFTLINLANLYPTNNEVAAFKETAFLAGGGGVVNDWGDGWWLKYYGIDTNYFGGASYPDYNNWRGLALTREDTNCSKIRDWNLSHWQKINLYKCDSGGKWLGD
jgi:hypothetical protein